MIYHHMIEKARLFWRHPAGWALLLACALVGIGECYPFTPFPMYSNPDGSADILYVTDQTDAPLPMRAVFGVGSAQGKKRYEKVLRSTPGLRDSQRATPTEMRAAGQQFLATLSRDTKPKALQKYSATGLKLWLKRINMAKGHFDPEIIFLAEQPLPPPPP